MIDLVSESRCVASIFLLDFIRLDNLIFDDRCNVFTGSLACGTSYCDITSDFSLELIHFRLIVETNIPTLN